jgi:hypothetical protein
LALARRLADLPAMDIMATQGAKRLDIMVRSQFAADGGHVEHSPEYHSQLLATFAGALQAGLISDEHLRQRLTAAEDVLGWFTQPNGELVQVGDSQALEMRSRVATASQTANFVFSRGERGMPDERALRVLREAGYAIVRSPQPRGTRDHDRAGYLVLAAGFHSRAHKHADDLTVCWFDRGRELLIDSGRYGYVDLLPADSPMRQRGYYYGAPQRQYVESTRAHNTVEADGEDHDRRNRKPYGSAILDAEERDGHFRLRAQVDHGEWLHQRAIIFRPGQWLYVADTVTAMDEDVHDFRAWWNMPVEVSPRRAGDSTVEVEVAGSEDPLWIADLAGSRALDPVSGQEDPLRGWRSKRDLQFTPAWSIGFEALATAQHEFEVLFCFAPQAPTRVPAHPFEDDRDA